MTEQEIKVFVDGTMSYFSEIGGEAPQVGVPYPKSNDSKLMDYTGAIGISGAKKGCVYITTSRALLVNLLKSYPVAAQATANEEGFVMDMAGELANTVAGNAQQAFGAGFMISLPMVITGQPNDIRLPLGVPAFEIPFTWKGNEGYLVVGLN